MDKSVYNIVMLPKTCPSSQLLKNCESSSLHNIFATDRPDIYTPSYFVWRVYKNKSSVCLFLETVELYLWIELTTNNFLNIIIVTAIPKTIHDLLKL